MQITRFGGGPVVLDVVDIAEPAAGPEQQLYDVSTAGADHADTLMAVRGGTPSAIRSMVDVQVTVK